MTTRAEEIAAKEYPDLFIRDDKMKTSGTALISDAAQMLRREGFINGYKQGQQGQQDRWIPLSERYPERGSRFILWNARKKQASPGIFTHDMDEVNWTQKYGFTHWCDYPSSPNPDQQMSTTLSQRLRGIHDTMMGARWRGSGAAIIELQKAIAQAEAQEGRAVELSDEEIWNKYTDFITWLTSNQLPRTTVYAVDQWREHFRDAIRYARDHGYLRWNRWSIP